jgi:hypothetical protein
LVGSWIGRVICRGAVRRGEGRKRHGCRSQATTWQVNGMGQP